MSKAIKLSTNGTVSLIEVPEKRDFRWYAEQIGCDYIEIVYPNGLDEHYQMIVDEEGLLKFEPYLNFIGSWLYGTQEHGSPIVGDALIMKDEFTDDGINTAGIPDDEAEELAEKFRGMFITAYMTLRKKLMD